MSETLPVTKMTLNEQHCTMNKRVICQLFFGFRDNYTERLTCHHREEKRDTEDRREEKGTAQLKGEKKEGWKKGKKHDNVHQQAKQTHTFTHVSTLPK